MNRRPVETVYSDGRSVLMRYNRRGDLGELEDWNGTTSMEYGPTGIIRSVTDHEGLCTVYSHDRAGNRTGITCPDGSRVEYTPDRNGRLAMVTDPEGDTAFYEYDSAGNILAIRQPGSVSTYTYDAASRPTAVKYQSDDGTVMENSYAYDAVGRITGITRKTENAGNMGTAGNVPVLKADLPGGLQGDLPVVKAYLL